MTDARLDIGGRHTIWVPAGAMVPRATSPAAFSTYDSGTQDITITVLDFDPSTQQYAHFHVGMPKSWNEGTVTYQAYWTTTGGSAGQTVRWSLAGRALSDDDAINGTFGTAQTVDDTRIANNDLHIADESAALTIGNTPAENDLVVFQVSRVSASDTLSVVAKLIGVKLFYSINTFADD